MVVAIYFSFFSLKLYNVCNFKYFVSCSIIFTYFNKSMVILVHILVNKYVIFGKVKPRFSIHFVHQVARKWLWFGNRWLKIICILESSVLSLSKKQQYDCLRCGRSYKNKGTLTRHQQYECGQTPRFACATCDKRFKRKEYLYVHFSRGSKCYRPI